MSATVASAGNPGQWRRPSVLPGFGLTMGYTLLYLSLIVLIPLAALFLKTATLGWGGVLGDRHRAARAGLAAPDVRRRRCSPPLVNAVFGLLVAWVLVRYQFPGQARWSTRWSICRSPCRRPWPGIALTALYAPQRLDRPVA